MIKVVFMIILEINIQSQLKLVEEHVILVVVIVSNKNSLQGYL
jgi:hypothetical protein